VGAEFVVVGTPKSLQASSSGRNRWKAKVTQAAQRASGLSMELGLCRLHIYFFFDGKTDLDVDNIVKPISDALNTVVYPDDGDVVDVHAAKRDLNNPGHLISPPASVLAAIAQKQDFVFIMVGPANANLEF
jgi:crossover junction endodeoxyribonuclease RusA